MNQIFLHKRILLLGIIFISILPQSIAREEIKIYENKGQLNKAVQFSIPIRAGNIYIENSGLTVDLISPQQWDEVFGHDHGHNADPSLRNAMSAHAYKVNFKNSTATPTWTAYNPHPERYNYFRGKDESKWASNVKAYTSVLGENIYPGIDIKFQQNGSHLKYDLFVAAGADPKQIIFEYQGVDKLSINDGKLEIQTSVNTIYESQPIAWQYHLGKKILVPCAYELEKNTVKFKLGKGYNPQLPLIIDPTLEFASYTGSRSDNFGFTATYDTMGNLYAGGIAFASGYPTTIGAYQSSFAALADVGISKFDATGATLIYSTYLGGASTETPHSIIVNSRNELLILGSTGSRDFPVTNTAYDTTHNGGTSVNYTSNGSNFVGGTDIYIAKLSVGGSSLLGCTFIGGSLNDGLNDGSPLQYNYGDQFRGEIIVDGQDKVYVASSTLSTDFPASAGSFQPSSGGSKDGVVFKMDKDLQTLEWASYLGGLAHDAGLSIKLNSSNEIYVTGGTTSNNLNIPGTAYINSAPGGLADGYIYKISNDGTTILAATYVGTSGFDQPFFVEIDRYDNIFIVGQTDGNYPVTSNTYNVPNSGQFISKFDPNLTNLLVSTVYGKGDGDPELSPTAFLVDICDNIYVSSWGGTTNSFNTTITDYNMSGLDFTPDAFDSTTDGSDFYFLILSRDAQSLVYATYLGGSNSGDHVDGGTSRLDKQGKIYQAICASCGVATNDFPTTLGAYSRTDSSINPQANCNMAVVKFDFQQKLAFSSAEPDPSAIGCVPYTLSFTNFGTGHDFIWDFGDGSPPTTIPNPTHTYNDTGVFYVQLISIDSLSCNLADTGYIEIIVHDTTVVADFEADDICFPFPLQFNNLSTDARTYDWDFDGLATSTDMNPNQALPAGTHNVQLIAYNPGACNLSDTITKPVTVFPQASASFTYSPTTEIHNEEPIDFNNTSTLASSYWWSFGDGATSTERNPTHAYSDTGTYQVCMVANTPQSCPDTICDIIVISEVAFIDLPTGFSPNGDNTNDIFYVRGAGIESVDFRIYNRWGELVFQTDNIKNGWDGTFRQEPQEMEVYTYYLSATLINKQNVERKGNITLVR